MSLLAWPSGYTPSFNIFSRTRFCSVRTDAAGVGGAGAGEAPGETERGSSSGMTNFSAGNGGGRGGGAPPVVRTSRDKQLMKPGDDGPPVASRARAAAENTCAPGKGGEFTRLRARQTSITRSIITSRSTSAAMSCTSALRPVIPSAIYCTIFPSISIASAASCRIRGTTEPCILPKNAALKLLNNWTDFLNNQQKQLKLLKF